MRVLVSLSLVLMMSPISRASEFDDLVQKDPRGGYVDIVPGTDAVWIPDDAYILQAGEKTLVMQAPANRFF